jgi:hypothetical protein
VKITLELPDALTERFKASLPFRHRSKLVAELLTPRLTAGRCPLECARWRSSPFRRARAECNDWEALNEAQV